MSYYEIAPMIISLGFFFILVVLAIIGLEFSSIYIRRTHKYRKDLCNLYVAGRIRQIATENKVDLGKEYKVYKDWEKKRNMEYKAMDDVIEEELKDKIYKEKEEMKKS